MARCTAYVDIAAYRRNLRALWRLVKTPILAVVKANAYGHGSVELASAARDVRGVAGFCVATVEEGLVLRKAGIGETILVFTPTDAPAEAAAAGLTVSVSNKEQLDAVAALPRIHRPVVHVEVDTGMHRMGVAAKDLPTFLAYAGHVGIIVSALYTHFSSADEDDPSPTEQQFALFTQVGSSAGLMTHAANSAATLRYPQTRLDAVRLGGATFGLSTGADEIFDVTEPVLTLEADVVRVHEVPLGAGLGYGLEDVSDEPRVIATLGIGYGDGLPRSLSRGGPVLLGGRRCQVVGRISMDFTTVDATGTGARVSDRAVLIGEKDGSRIRAEDLAAHAGTISYDITTGLLTRVPRVHLNKERSREER